MTEIKEFWYESNACWGTVKSLKDLEALIKLQLEENNGINTIDDFLNNSRQIDSGENNFGTRREYGGKPLRDFLREQDFDFSLLDRLPSKPILTKEQIEYVNKEISKSSSLDKEVIVDLANGNQLDLHFNLNENEATVELYLVILWDAAADELPCDGYLVELGKIFDCEADTNL